MADIRHVREYATLIKKKKTLVDGVEKIDARLEELRAGVLAYFERTGVESVRQKDLPTLFLREEIWAGREDGVENKEAIAALKKAGLGDYAAPRINTQKLSAFCRELNANGEPLPKPLIGKIKVTKVYKIGSRAK